MRWLGLLLLTASLAGADTYVVAAGVEKYDDPGIVSLQFAVADVTSLANLFRDRGVPADHINLLTSAAAEFAQRPTRSNVLAALQRVRRRAVAGDTVLFIFSGHGMEADGQAYLLTVDCSRELLKDTALPLSLVHEALRGLQADNLLFVIDACRNDPTSSKAVADAALAEPFAKGLRPKLAEETAEQKDANIAVLTACDVGQRAWEIPEEGHGVFTYYLLQALGGAAADQDGRIGLSAINDYLREQVGAWAARARREQTPRLDISQGKDFPLLTVPAKPKPVDPPPPGPARLMVESQPAGAEVLLDGQVVGTTPLTLEVPLPVAVERALTLRLTGFEEFRTKVALTPGQESRVPRATLRKLPDPRPPKPTVEPQPPVTEVGERPKWWPGYLSNYQLPAGRSWHDFRMRQADGMVQVRIPAGEFKMGDPSIATQQRAVTVTGYWMDLHEVTISQYGRFVDKVGIELPFKIPSELRRQTPWVPVTFVDHARASEYAKWVGGRLPTPEEWERAARGGVDGRLFPWGDDWNPELANGGGLKPLLEVGRYAPNGYGLLDLIGNVAEWCAAADGRLPEIRGGSYRSEETLLRIATVLELSPNTANTFVGLRCVQDE